MSPPAARAGGRCSLRSSRCRTGACSATPTSATSPTTSCPHGSASWSGATRSAKARASAGRRSSARSSWSGSSIRSSSWGWPPLAVVVLGRRRRRSRRPSSWAPRSSGCWSSASASRSPSHRLPGADRVTAFAERLSAGPRPRRGDCATGWRWPAGRGRSSRHWSSAPSAWAASIATFVAGGQAVGIELTPRPGRAALDRRRAGDDRAVGPGLPRDVRADRGRDRLAVRRRGECRLRDGPAGPRHDPGRDVGRWAIAAVRLGVGPAQDASRGRSA